LRRLRTPADLSTFIRSRGPFELCIWDFDGVVCDSEPWQAASYETLLSRRGTHPRADFFESYVGLTETEIWDRLDARYDLATDRQAAARERSEVLRPALLTEARPNWFVRPALAAVRATGTRSVIVSSGRLDIIEPYLDAWSLAPLFDAISGQAPEVPSKTERLSTWLASARGRVLLFEDVDAYLALGSARGAVVVGVLHGLNANSCRSADAVMIASPEAVGSNSS